MQIITAAQVVRAALANTATLRASAGRWGDTTGRRDGWAVRCGQFAARYATRSEAEAAAQIAAAAYAAWLAVEAPGLEPETFTVEPCTVFVG